ncbi:hypothetical protein HanIR_Chr06g0280171 [Helianthus annuus]|nr:hypothetical protein HanIR_Chr06g0280171 [Helianthus annuus]
MKPTKSDSNLGRRELVASLNHHHTPPNPADPPNPTTIAQPTPDPTTISIVFVFKWNTNSQIFNNFDDDNVSKNNCLNLVICAYQNLHWFHLSLSISRSLW